MRRSAYFVRGARALAFSALASAPCLADTLSPGFHPGGTRSIGLFDAYATLSNGNRVVFDGVSVDLVDDNGILVLHLGALASFEFPSLVLIDPTETFALVAESTDVGSIYKVDLAGGGMSHVTDLDFNYDAVWEDADHVLISASPCGFGCGSEIYRVTVSSGAQSVVVSTTGPSGPLALSPAGDLYYVVQSTSFPPPPGSSSILRWTPAQITSGFVQLEPDASVFASGLDGGAALEFEGVFGHLFVAESLFGGESEVSEFDRAGALVGTVVTSSNSFSNLEFAYGPGPGSFQAFQPADGVSLRYRSTDYVSSISEIITVRPKRPTAIMHGPGSTGPGYVTFRVTDANPNSWFVIVQSPAQLYSSVERTLDRGNFLFHTGLHYILYRLDAVYVPTNANGSGTFTFFNPGNWHDTRALQALITDEDARFIGSSNAVLN